MNFFKKNSFYIFLIFSSLIHALLIYQIIKESEKSFLALKSKPRILVDLTIPKDDFYDKNKKVISRFNYQGKGKLHPKKGQHLTGDFNSQAANNNSDLEKSKKSLISKAEKLANHKTKFTLKSFKRGALAQKKKNNKIKKPLIVSKKSEEKKKESKKRLSVNTENSLENKFWFDEADFLQISVRSHPNSEFNLELANLLKKRLGLYLLAGGSLNFYFVKKDEAVALATINQDGVVSFEKLVKPSLNQPYLNYLVKQVVDNPGLIKNIPDDLKGKHEKLNFFFSISFSGPPLRKWWMGFNFINQKK